MTLPDTSARAPFLIQCDGYRFRAISALVTAALLFADEHLAADEAGQRQATERFLTAVWDYKAGRLGE